MCSDLYLLDRFSLPFSLSLPLSFVRLFVLFAFPFFFWMSVALVLQ